MPEVLTLRTKSNSHIDYILLVLLIQECACPFSQPRKSDSHQRSGFPWIGLRAYLSGIFLIRG